jgi:peptide-methionine (S)-S-oxide reductase
MQDCNSDTGAAFWRRTRGNFHWRLVLATLAFLALGLTACQAPPRNSNPPRTPTPGLAVATFAGGCFWCMEPPFDRVDGVVATVSGYTGGQAPNPDYESVASGWTGHAEAVQVEYDPQRVSYEALLGIYWRNVDPTVRDRQFCDIGSAYRAAIFYHNEAQRRAAEASRAQIERSKPFPQPIVIDIVPASAFYAAESYHQDYYLKNPWVYNYYRMRCGRDRRLEELWGPNPG